MFNMTRLSILTSVILCLFAVEVFSVEPLVEMLFDDSLVNYGTSGGFGDFIDVGGAVPVYAAGGPDGGRCLDNTSAASMGGSGGSVRFASDTQLSSKLTNLRSFTVMGWVKSDSPLSSLAGLVSYTDFRVRGHSTNRLVLQVEGANYYSSPAANYDASDWLFFAVTYDGTSSADNVIFYYGSNDGTDNVNIDSVVSSDKGTVFMNPQFFYIGNVNTSGTSAFDGLMDSVRVFGSKFDDNGSLGIDEIKQWKNSHQADVDRFRVLDTRFEGNVVSEGSINDIGFLRQYNGIYPSYSSGGVDGGLCLDMTTADTMGGRGPFFSFAETYGVNAMLEDAASFTVMGWIKSSDALGGGARIFSYIDGSGNGFEVTAEQPNRLRLYINGIGYDSSTAGNYNCTDWKFFAIRYDGTRATSNIIFFFGNNDGTDNVTVDSVHTTGPGIISGDTGGACIGNRGTIYPFDGYIDSVKVFVSKDDGVASLGTSEIGAYKNEHAATVDFPLPDFECRKSDVAIMRTSSAVATHGFNANRVVWNYDTHGGVVGGFEALGVAASQTMNFTATAYDGGTNYADGKYYTNDPTWPSRTRDFDGNLVQKNGYPDDIYYPSVSSQAFQDDTFGRVMEALLPLEPYNVQFDGPSSIRHAAYLGYGVGFDDATLEGFRQYLDNKYSGPELLSLYNISDITTFNYRDWLVSEYSVVDNDDYLARYHSFSLTEDFEYFMEDEISDTFRTLTAVCNAASPPAKLSLNMATMRWYSRPLITIADFLNMELTPAEQYGGLDQADAVRCKVAEAFDVPAYMVNNLHVSYYIQQNDKPGYMNSLISAVYANGGVMLCPWNLWAGDGPRYYSHWDRHGAFTHFVRNNAELFDDYEPLSQVGLLWNCDNPISEIDLYGEMLFNLNVPYDIVPLGDRYPYSRIDVPGVADRYDQVVNASDISSWSPENQVTVNQLGAQVDIVSHPYSLSLTDDWVNVSPINAPDIWVLPRKHKTLPLAPVVVHVVNRSYDSASDSVDKTACNIELHGSIIGEREVESVRWLGPENPAKQLAVTQTSAGFAVSLPETPAWSLLEINLKAAPGDFNRDGLVNLADIGIIASEWLLSGQAGTLESDATGNDFVDYLDFSELSKGWQGDN